MSKAGDAMAGKVCVITGATSGIGAATARGLARLGATVVAIGRNPHRGAAVVHSIRRETGNRQVFLQLADLSSQRQVRILADALRAEYSRLDVLINNAGAFYFRRRESVDGIEMTFALNHLAGFLLTNLLLDRLVDSAPARIITVSSRSHRRARMHWEDPFLTHGYNGLKAYGQSKLANVLFTYELARRLRGTDVTANAMHPGLVATRIATGRELPSRILRGAMNLFARSPEEGARTAIYLATSPDVAGVTGRYFVDEQPVDSSRSSYDNEAASRLWRLSAELTGLDPSLPAR
ncbi:MAG: SDR family oxidoreductase [Anaerolineae bacterium]